MILQQTNAHKRCGVHAQLNLGYFCPLEESHLIIGLSTFKRYTGSVIENISSETFSKILIISNLLFVCMCASIHITNNNDNCIHRRRLGPGFGREIPGFCSPEDWTISSVVNQQNGCTEEEKEEQDN